jgi:uncharacterized membrane protein HdeD (DUF308 family)
MIQTISRTIKESIRYWWLFLLTGLILIAVGIWILSSPVQAYVSLSMLFAASILVIGIIEAIFAITARKSLDGWGWTLASGLLDIVIGAYLLSYPLLTITVLPIILGFWLLFRGISAIGFAFDMKSYRAANWGWLLALGILIIIFGLMVLAVPAFGVLNIILWTSLSFITAGFFRVVLAFRLKKLDRPA